MKKQTNGIIALSAAVVLLGGGLAYLKHTDGSGDSDTSSESSAVTQTAVEGANLVLIDDTTELPRPLSEEPVTDANGNELLPPEIEKSPVKSAKVTNSSGVLEVVKTSDSGSGDDAVYTLAGYEKYDVNNAVVGTLVNNANGMTSASLVEEDCSDLSKFGLDKPGISVELTYEDGVVRKFYIGDKSPVSEQYYVRLEESDTVYTVHASTLANYRMSAVDFVRTTVLEKPADDEYPKVNSLRIERDDIDYDIYLVYGENSDDTKAGGTSATHEMVEPIKAYLTVERSSPITNGMFGLSAKRIDTLGAKPADIKAAGLEDPFCRVTMDCDDGNTYVLLLSNVFDDEDGTKCCRGMLEGSDIIYVLDADKASWVKVMPIDIASRRIITTFVWNIDKLTIEANNGKKAEFTIEPKEAGFDRSSGKTEDFNVTMNGKEFDAERYRSFYGFLIDGDGEEFAINAEIPEDKPTVTLTYNDSYLKKEYRIDYYEYSSMTALVVINGEPKFLCQKSYVETMIGNIGRLETGEEYVLKWK